uniref:Major facilitator superfamily (MFS) profile domain-containing protein n=1 Tax=Timema tahoe TaxID=61484 RepID=A0A7R9IQW0_9NEOP|nr:unnamed protein product [Timema tahoe]
MDGDKLPLQTGRKLPQYLAACISSINTICCGSVFAWSAPALPYLQSALASDVTTTQPGDNYTYYNVSEDLNQRRVNFDNNGSIGLPPDDTISVAEGSIISSLVAIGCLVGSLPAGQLANAFGRRTMLQVMNVPLLVGWIIIIFADRHVALLCTARFVQGISLGLGAVMTPLYNEEIADTHVRGSLGVIYDLMLTVGILWSYIAGASLPYLWLNISSAFTAVLSAILLFFIPESPVHLLLKNKRKKAEDALRWLRSKKHDTNYDPNQEIHSLQRLVDKTKVYLHSRSITSLNPTSLAGMFTVNNFTGPTAKSFYIILSLLVLRQLGGINALTFYTVDIFKEAGSSMSPYVSSAVLGLVEFLMTLATFTFVDRLGRRTLLLLSSILMGACLTGISLLGYLKVFGYDVTLVEWLPLVLFALYLSAFSVGFGPIPWFMMAELIPTESKGWVTGVVATVNWLAMFLVTQLFPGMVVSIRVRGDLPRLRRPQYLGGGLCVHLCPGDEREDH